MEVVRSLTDDRKTSVALEKRNDKRKLPAYQSPTFVDNITFHLWLNHTIGERFTPPHAMIRSYQGWRNKTHFLFCVRNAYI